jgi:hypothetical protein
MGYPYPCPEWCTLSGLLDSACVYIENPLEINTINLT